MPTMATGKPRVAGRDCCLGIIGFVWPLTGAGAVRKSRLMMACWRCTRDARPTRWPAGPSNAPASRWRWCSPAPICTATLPATQRRSARWHWPSVSSCCRTKARWPCRWACGSVAVWCCNQAPGARRCPKPPRICGRLRWATCGMKNPLKRCLPPRACCKPMRAS